MTGRPNLLDDRLHLIGGPYVPPPVKPGDWLEDVIDGPALVGGYSRGPIPWPRRRKTGRASLIFCGDLVRAVRTESALAIMSAFGVSGTIVARWRTALEVGRDNPGTGRLYQAYKPLKLTETAAAKGRTHAAEPDVIARIAEAKRGRPAHPNTRKALREAAARPKGAEWGERANRWMRDGKARDRSGDS